MHEVCCTAIRPLSTQHAAHRTLASQSQHASHTAPLSSWSAKGNVDIRHRFANAWAGARSATSDDGSHGDQPYCIPGNSISRVSVGHFMASAEAGGGF
eukprot:3881009-Rhodomonas_salina.1